MTSRDIQAPTSQFAKPFSSPRFALWRSFSCIFIMFLGAGNCPQFAYGQQPAAKESSIISPSPETSPTDGCWTWIASGKHNESDLARCLSVGGNEQLELRFYKHQFGNVSVWLPDARDLRSHKSLADEMKKNQVPVILTFDDGEPLTETWAIIQDPDSGIQLLTPRGNYARIYGLMLKSKRFSISYPDKGEKPLTAVFDVSAMPLQVQAHDEKIHHFGMKDALEVGGIALGSF